ncbi:MAG: phosphate-starvation-inducible PsiE family protein [Fischerella sp.]|nr:phosphate-starvation-inducible PsiE family protein [Fischerella sp.]
MFKIWNNSPSPWKTLVSREQIVHYLETVQDAIVMLLCIGLFSIMLIRMGELFFSLMHPLQFQTVTSDILFLLILVELFRLLIIYLQERRISVGVAVEVSIVSALREVILRGVVEIPRDQLWAICGFLTVLGGLLIIRALQARIFKPIEYSENHPLL